MPLFRSYFSFSWTVKKTLRWREIEQDLVPCSAWEMPQKMEEAIKAVKHSDTPPLLIEHSSKKSYIKTQQDIVEWVAIFLHGDSTPFAETDLISHSVPLMCKPGVVRS
jgi:hypothetical protein